METAMNHPCPKCSEPMTAGHIRDLGLGSDVLSWSEGAAERNSLGVVKTSPVRYAIEAQRCPKCGLVEMYAQERAY